uniref:Uncharacterized protein LOC114343441 n=1 Tax=Diabrotica virgifera virgifera TaxID=50390 RepID=A0A6P7GVM6_DIAVI
MELDPEKQKEIWEQYLKDLFADQRTEEPPQIDLDGKLNILTEEVMWAIKDAKNNKAPGEDLTTAEHFKHLSDDAVRKLTYLFNIIYEHGTLPHDWLTSTYCYQAEENMELTRRKHN